MMLDETSSRMLAEAYDETVRDAVAQGYNLEVAHKEGITAAAMFLSSLSGAEDSSARSQVEGLGLRPN